MGGNYPRLSGWTQCNHKMVFIRERGRQESQRRCDDGSRGQREREREGEKREAETERGRQTDRLKDTLLLALKMEEAAINQGM